MEQYQGYLVTKEQKATLDEMVSWGVKVLILACSDALVVSPGYKRIEKDGSVM
jgi:hypothetical protein